MRRTINLDSNGYALLDETSIKRSPQSLAAGVTRQTGQIKDQDFNLYQQFTIRPPWGIGLKNGNDPHRIYAEYNVNSLFTALTRGPQKQSVTLPAGTIAYNRFDHANSELYAMSRRVTTVAGQTGTKFYLHDAADDRSLTGFPASAESSGGTTVKPMNPTIGTTQASVGVSGFTGQGARMGFFVSPPLASQTIAAQNITINIAVNLSGTTPSLRVRLYVFRPSNQTVPGYLIGSLTTSILVTSTATAGSERSWDEVIAGSAVTCQDGDILVLEYYAVNGNAGTITIYYDGATETTIDDTLVSNHAAFINFTNNLTFSGARPAKVAGRLCNFTGGNTFTDTTVDTDTNLNYCQGVVQASERILALSGFPFGGSGGQNFNAIAQSWDGTTWEAAGLQVQNSFFFVDIALVGADLYVLYSNDITYPTWWRLSTLTGINFATLTTQKTVGSKSLPRRLISYPNSAGTEVPWVAAADGLWMQDTRIVEWFDTQTAFSGLHITRDTFNGIDSLLWNDGRNVFQGFWGENDIFIVVNLGPQSKDDGLADWVSSDDTCRMRGTVTALASTNEREWVAAGIGGEDSTHRATVHILDAAPETTSAGGLKRAGLPFSWHCPYANTMPTPAASRIIRAAIFSRENDGTSRLLIMEDNGTTDDVDAFMFENILENPVNIPTYAFNANNGRIITSEFKPLAGQSNVGFMAIQVETRDLSAAKAVYISDGQNGAEPTNANILTSAISPPQVWPDKSDATAGVGVAARSQQIVARMVDTNGANATAGPTVLEITQTYLVKGLMPDGTSPEEFEFVIDLHASQNLGTNRDNPKNVLQLLQTTAQKMVLVPLVLDGKETVQVTVDTYNAAIDPQLQAAIQQAPAGGTVVVRARELMR